MDRSIRTLGRFSAILCDLDGTLVDSRAALARSWERWLREEGVVVSAADLPHGVPANTIIETVIPSHRREMSAARLQDIEIADADGVREMVGARRFLARLPSDKWAIVTSSTSEVALARMRAAMIPPPAVLVTSDDVTGGKPSPEPFLRAAALLGVSPDRCLVIEDSDAGVAAGLAAGCAVLIVSGDRTVIPEDSAAPIFVSDLRLVRAHSDGDAVVVELHG
ncbi:HAD-IA family hydrolase [Microbispora sp. NPDC046933]|uniref:HAD-IA family hydrolase n=1 Tax=Microbispora sp. NPDC046933 TaxID=3155618 RepID=UPI0033FB87D5